MLPARGTSARDDTLAGQPRLRRRTGPHRRDVRRRRAYLAEHLMPPLAAAVTARGARARRRRGDRDAVGPAPALAGRRRGASRCCPGGWRALRLLWIIVLLRDPRRADARGDVRLLARRGFGRRCGTPYFERHPLRPVQGVMWVLFREAKRVLRLDIVTEGPTPDAYPGRPAAGLLPARRTGRLVHAHPRAHALVRPRAARRPQGHAAVGPGDRRTAAPDPRRFISPNPGGGQDLESQIRALATGLDDERRVRDLPRGRQLHRGAPATGRSPGCASSASSGWRSAPSR